MCGICIPSCPTYQQTHDENNSPRGRISLIQGILQNKINNTPAIQEHLHSCLQCLTCQSICPSQVNYDEIISYSQSHHFLTRKGKWLSFNYIKEQINLQLLTYKPLRKTFILLVNFLNFTNFLPVIKTIASTLKIKSILFLPNHSITSYPYKKSKSPSITLFSGCATSLFDSLLIEHTIKLLGVLKIKPIEIDNNCCGAVFKRQGDATTAEKHISKINTVHARGSTIISLNTSCSAFIAKNSKQNNSLTTDTISYFSGKLWNKMKRLKFSSYHNRYNNKVLFHQSCSMRNQLKNQNNCLKLLNLIPNMLIKTIPSMSCCGASGSYMLTHATMAEKIASPVIDYIIKEDIHCIISSDISCSLHLKQQLEKDQYYVEVLHPISLLYLQLSK